MFSNIISGKNHKACHNCPLIRCYPVKLELRLQRLEAESRGLPRWPGWLVVDILGIDSNRQRQTAITT